MSIRDIIYSENLIMKYRNNFNNVLNEKKNFITNNKKRNEDFFK